MESAIDAVLLAARQNGDAVHLDPDFGPDPQRVIVEEAERRGYLRQVSGTWSATDIYELTNKGRERLGLPPRPTLLDRCRRLLTWPSG